MAGRFALITFDVYTALFDIGSLLPAIAAHLPGADGAGLLKVWRSKQLEYALISNSLGRGRTSFRELTGRALDYAVAAAGAVMSAAGRADLVAAWDTLKPWPEAIGVMRLLLERGYVLGLLSNGDQAGLAALSGALPGVTHVFSSETAGWYKPHPAVYALPLNRLGLAPGQVLHVAGSATDVMGACSAGLPVVWSNRTGDRITDRALLPAHEFTSLAGLAALLQ